MRAPRKREVIVILEDAYKQNGVYRPWTEPAPAPQAQHSHIGIGSPFQYEPLESGLKRLPQG